MDTMPLPVKGYCITRYLIFIDNLCKPVVDKVDNLT